MVILHHKLIVIQNKEKKKKRKISFLLDVFSGVVVDEAVFISSFLCMLLHLV